MPKISIIIPNYNNEKYLDRCIDSAINQKYKEVEIICVDDKSTDNSVSILKKYAKLDDRIKLILLEENAGVSNARNKALKACTGDYVCFLDSDDYIEPNFCTELYKSITTKNSDIACGGHIKVTSLNQRLGKWRPTKDISFNPIKDVHDFTRYRNVTQKLFKISIIRDNNIWFNTDLNYMEDALFLITYLKHSKSISGVKRILYDVQINSNSLCRNQDLKSRREKDKIMAMKAISDVSNS